MKETPKRFLGLASSVMTIALLAAMTFVLLDRDARPTPALLFDYHSTTPTTVEVFFDVGAGFEGQSSRRQFVPRQSSWREIRLDLPKERIRKLRLDPADTAGTFWIRNPRVVAADGTVRLAIPLANIRPANQILSMREHNGELEIQTPPDANDPILDILDSAVDLRWGWRIVPRLAAWMLFWTAVVALLYCAPRLLQGHASFLLVCRTPTAVIWLAAIVGTLLSAAPVAFRGKSFMSPNAAATPLFYDRFPTLPNYSDSTTEDCYGADTGAMDWQHFPLTVAQERSIKTFGEFPLWNRYNSAGTTMIGQGQMMLGDPLNWLMWFVGVEASTFDVKFLLLRVIFAASLGLSVLMITRAPGPSVMVALTAPFITFFMYRVNHPDIFSLCYAPLISLAWLTVIYAEDQRGRRRWVVGLMVANWLVMNSGTVKEAYMFIVVLNLIGLLHFLVERPRFGAQFASLSALLLLSGVCFLMIASPLLGTLSDYLKSGSSVYHAPGVQQYPLWYFLGFVDNIFYLIRLDTYSPAVNALLFVGFLLGLLYIRLERPEARRSAVVLILGSAMLIAIAFGVIPAKLLLAVPYLGNVRHVDTTFSTILIVPVCILAGIGFANIDLQRKARVDPIVVLILIVLVLLYVESFAENGGLRLRQFFAYSAAVLLAAVYAPWLTLSLLKGRLSFSGIGVCLIALLVVVGRGAMYGDSPDRFVFNPHERIRLTFRPALVDRLTSSLRGEPTRMVGLGAVLFPGYNATLGLENISGPDAIFNKAYRELTGALKLPHDESLWRIVLNWHDVRTYRNALDLLGVGFVLSSIKAGAAAMATYVDSDGSVYAYSRPSAWPRAFYTDRVVLYDDVQSLADRISKGDGRPFVAVARKSADGNATLQQLVEKPALGPPTVVAAKNYVLTNNSTSFTIDASAPGVVYLGETDEPGDFIVTMNGKPVPYVTANHAFKAVAIDGPGEYRVTFRYWPAHLTGYLWLASGGLVLWVGVLIVFGNHHKDRARHDPRASGKRTLSLPSI